MTVPPPHDIYFQESILDVRQVFAAVSAEWLDRTALLVFTPDALVSTQVGAAIRLLGAAGFQPLAAANTRIDRLACREIWRREVSVPEPDTLDRLAVCDLLFPYTDSIVVLLRDEQPVGRPATERLRRFKGSGEPALRDRGSLRSLLYSPNNVFRLVHASDGPDQMVRELGILFDTEPRRALLRDVRRGGVSADALNRLAAAAIDGVGERELETLPSIQRVAALVDDRLRGASQHAGLLTLRAHLATLATGASLGFRVLRDAVDAAGLTIDQWDLIALGAQSLARGSAVTPAGAQA